MKQEHTKQRKYDYHVLIKKDLFYDIHMRAYFHKDSATSCKKIQEDCEKIKKDCDKKKRFKTIVIKKKRFKNIVIKKKIFKKIVKNFRVISGINLVVG